LTPERRAKVIDRQEQRVVAGGAGDRRPPRKHVAAVATGVGLILLFGVGGVRQDGPAAAFARQQGAAEQEPHIAERVVRTVELTPRIGTAGTRVTLTASRLPSLTPVQIVIGATRSGFEGLVLAQTSIDGDLRASVEIPGWTHRDQPHRFLVFNAYFSSVLAESGIIHVTDADGRVVREGTVGSAGPACATLEGDDGERYRLVGRTQDLVAGDRAVVEGVIREADDGCGENLSFELVLASNGGATRSPASPGR
jgi:hypothetical protein